MSSIRLLILGVLRRKQPIHGYEVRRELEAWGANWWANIAYGSIYSALNKMAEEGLVAAVGEDHHKVRTARIEYTLTPEGRSEYERLLREYWWEMKPIIDPFQIALCFMDSLPREELLAVLHHRANQLRAALGSVDFSIASKLSYPGTPRHTAENVRLSAAHVEAELRWIEEAIAKVERGELP